MAPPSVYTWSQEHKVLSCMSVFLIGNSIEGGLLQTGAFEVELNGMPVWSKLKSGRVPQGHELFDIINNQLELSDSQFPKIPQMSPPPPPQDKPEHQKQNVEYGQHETTADNDDDFIEFDTREEL